MSFFSQLRERASSISIFDKTPPDPHKPKKLTKDELFRLEFRLPDTENIIDQTSVELLVVSEDPTTKDDRTRANVVFQGKLYLTEKFLIFRDDFDSKSCSFVTQLSMIRKVERIPSKAYVFALALHTVNNLKVMVQFIGLRSRSEQFSHNLKVQLKEGLREGRDSLPPFLDSLYSEFLIKKNSPYTKNKDQVTVPAGGLGLIFKYPGDPRKLKDKSKLRLWYDYFLAEGRNLSISRDKMFYKLLRVGLPNRLRGEMWCLTSGAMYLHYQNQTTYQTLLRANVGKQSLAIEEIEKDLNRSLPEYSAYQSPEGISRLRNVLTAYSWKNPEIGYCQAMNIVTAALLIFQSEEQAFWTLSQLIEKYVPGYYSKTMYGTLLDQRVFEALVEKTMPILWEHITRYDIQLSVVSLPWFLSLFLNSMPLVFAFRIMDVFFVHGPRVLFQVALAILRVNGEELLAIDDDGMFISVLKKYFLTLDDSAHPMAHDEKMRAVTKFQELLIVAFKEFSNVDDAMIEKERGKHRGGIMTNVESFIKKSQIRALPRVHNLNAQHISNIYDRFYESISENRSALGGSSTMSFPTFKVFLQGFCDWCLDDADYVYHDGDFLHSLFELWDESHTGELSLADVVKGLDGLYEENLMEAISNFFKVYDKEDRQEVDRETILRISEGLLYLTKPLQDGVLLDQLTTKAIETFVADEVYKSQQDSSDEIILPAQVAIDKESFQREQGERYLSSASAFISRSFEYAQPDESHDLLQLDETDNIKSSIRSNVALDPTHPLSLNLPTFRMVVLADETYELFFAKTLRDMIHLDKPPSSENKGGVLKDMFEGLLADASRVATQVRKRMDSQTVSPQTPTSSRASGRGFGVSTEEDDEDEDELDTAKELSKDVLNDVEVQGLGDIVPVGDQDGLVERMNDLSVLHKESTQNNKPSGDLIEFEH